MYSRNQAMQGSGISVPENYDGVAFTEAKPEVQGEGADRSIRVVGTPSQDTKMSPGGFLADEPKESAEVFKNTEDSAEAGLFQGLLGKIPTIGRLFSGGNLLGSTGIKMPKIGTEELLIIGIALFLLFNKDGDKECAIMLLLLIFVGN